jgi:hypothetical protein
MVAGNMQVVADVARIISQAEGVFGSRDKALLSGCVRPMIASTTVRL